MKRGMTIRVRFTDEDWARVNRDWAAWWAGELERPLVWIRGGDWLVPRFDQERVSDDKLFLSNYQDMPAAELVDLITTCLENTLFLGDAIPKWHLNFGPGIMAGFLGARVDSEPDTVWFSPSEHRPIHAIHPVYDAENVWWRRIQDLMHLLVERWEDRALVCFTDLGGNMDIIASLCETQPLLMSLYDAPEEVSRLVAEVTRLWLRFYEESYAVTGAVGRGSSPWAPIWSPERCYMLQSDFAYMISPQMFEQFVLPDLTACCDHLEHGFYHLDGIGQIAHLDHLLSIKRLRGIQWVPGAGKLQPQQWFSLLKRIRDAGKLCQLFVTPEGARTVVRELGGRGFVLAIEPALTEEEAQDLLRTLAREDITAPQGAYPW